MRRFVLRLRNVVRPSDAEPELARELASHLTLLADELERRGMPRDEAVRAARLSLGGVEQTKERHRDALAQERLVAMLFGFFGALALLLAAVGLHFVTAYAAGRRRSEIGIRMALGARRLEVLRLVMRQSAALTIVGLLIGLGGAIATTRYLEGLLFGVTPLDPATFIAVALMFAVVATVAAYVPARRATKVDPLLALRCE